MKRIILNSTLIFALLSAGVSFSNKPLWEKTNPTNAPQQFEIANDVADYQMFHLSTQKIKDYLSTAGKSVKEGVELQLPVGKEGEMKTFIVWETPIMQKGLASKMEHVKTYTGFAKDKHSITTKIDFTSVGFRGAIYTSSDIYFINPYTNQQQSDYYMYYNREDVKTLSPVTCDIDASLLYDNKLTEGELLSARMNQRSVYRIAISTTGEYAQSVASPADVVSVMEVIISTLNRVNGVFERELALTYELVDNNEDVVFTNPVSDPYSCNDQNDCLIDEVASVLSNIIGINNYDVGHIFNTAGGGIAALNSLCQNSNVKGMGVSTTTGPDDIGTILHELGHQMSANHSFSSAEGGCDGNGNPSTNYEPGSGNTIMSYLGACAPDNLPGQRLLYYNAYSLKEMTTYLDMVSSFCGEHYPINTEITFELEEEEYYVPKFTPYELKLNEASGPHPSAEIIYNWEQYQSGNYGASEADGSDATEGPIFQFKKPGEDLHRLFPDIGFILNDSYSGVGERLSNVARDVVFRGTARIFFQGYGGFKTSENETKIIVTNNQKFRVTGPSNDETWNPGEVKTITWDAGGSNSSPVNTGYVSIYLSLDNGQTYPFLIVSNAPNTGSYEYTVHDIGTSSGRIKVQGSGNVFFDIGKGKLNITGDPTNNIKEIEKQAPIIAFPNPLDDKLIIQRKEGSEGLLKISIYNILGQEIIHTNIKGNQEQFNTSQWPTGHYLIKTQDEKGMQHTIKVLKK